MAPKAKNQHRARFCVNLMSRWALKVHRKTLCTSQKSTLECFLFYVMYWRIFDRLVVSMPLPCRRISGQRVNYQHAAKLTHQTDQTPSTHHVLRLCVRMMRRRRWHITTSLELSLAVKFSSCWRTSPTKMKSANEMKDAVQNLALHFRFICLCLGW